MKELKLRETTAGLSSANQVSELTGFGASAILTTAGFVAFFALPGDVDLVPRSIAKTEIKRDISVPAYIARNEINSVLQQESDPALSQFIGPPGVPRSHSERASLLIENYRSVPDEQIYWDIPEDLF